MKPVEREGSRNLRLDELDKDVNILKRAFAMEHTEDAKAVIKQEIENSAANSRRQTKNDDELQRTAQAAATVARGEQGACLATTLLLWWTDPSPESFSRRGAWPPLSLGCTL